MTASNTLRLIVTSDLHMHLHPRDLLTGSNTARGLLALSGPIAQARTEVPCALLLDNGDVLQGTPLGEWHARDGDGAPHPIIATMNALGYDTGTLGNHEFDYGMGYLADVLAEATFPMVNCNLEITPPLPLRPSVILERVVDGRTIKIGITGTVPERITVWSRHLLAGCATVIQPEIAVAEEAARLRVAGADIVICLAHAGIVPPGDPEEASENGALLIAKTGAVDAIICGHQHLQFPGTFPHDGAGIDATHGTLAGIPAIMPGWAGEHLGILDLHLAEGKIVGHTAELRPCDTTTIDPALSALSEQAERAAQARLSCPLSRTNEPLNTAFALVTDTAAMRLIHAAQIWALKRLLPDGAHPPLLSSVAAFRTGGRAGPDGFTRIPAGPLTLRSIADLYPYENGFTAIEVTGAILRDWLEMSASTLSMLSPGRPQPLLRPGAPGYNFDMIAGVRYDIDLSQPAAFDLSGTRIAANLRIQNLSYNGASVADDQRFIVATNSYRAAGGGRFPHLADQSEVIKTTSPTASLLADYVASHPNGPPILALGWRMTAQQGAVAWIDGDRLGVPEFTYPAAQALGTSDGFTRWQFTF